MKIKIEISEGLPEEEVIIRCSGLTEKVASIEKALSSLSSLKTKFVFFKQGSEFFFPVSDVLFFETGEESVFAHTADDIYTVKKKLYEIEAALPSGFMRISKSAIINIDKIASISRNLSASSLITFQGSHKQVYVSRLYYKELRYRIDERR